VTGRPWRLGRGLAIVVALAAWVEPASADGAAATPPADEADLRARLSVTVAVTDQSLAATGAIADSLEEGVRGVIVRIVDGMELEVRLESRDVVLLPGPPFLCLVGPYAAPDDAGLSDRCWGEPGLTSVAADQLPLDSNGALRLQAGVPLTIAVELSRGHERCDYPPGTWRLEVTFSPRGTPAGPDRLALEDVPFEISPTNTEALALVPPGDSRYCGLATLVVREQGEPQVISPSPSP
jgi:hypothetical protein